MDESMTSAQPDMTGPTKRIVFVGHVDHGKSTLIGRLLFETGALPDAKIEAVRSVSAKRGKHVEWAFLLDSFQAERDQGVTIDVSQIFFRSDHSKFVIVDAPGHREFLKNMVTGAAGADAAILIIDAVEGVREQTRKHAYLLTLLGIAQVIVAVTKMDLVEFDEARFAEVETEVRSYLGGIGIAPQAVVPVSAVSGDNVVASGPSMSWYQGPSLMQALDRLAGPARPSQLPLRIPVQDVYKFDERRIIVGQIESGTLRVGDEVHFSPSGKVARVKTIEAWNQSPLPVEAHAGQAVGFTLDEQVFVERGELVSHHDHQPILTNVFRGRLFWFSDKPLAEGSAYALKINTAEYPVTVQSITRIVDVDLLSGAERDHVARHEVAEVVFRSRSMSALDEVQHLRHTGRFVLVDDHRIVGGGTISMDGYPDQRQAITVRSTNVFEVEHGVTAEARRQRNGHKGSVLWFTGLSGAGKSTLAVALERALFNKGYQVYVLDGDNVRHALSANLGFSPEDRAENIRRVAAVAALFADAGFIVISAFISPYRADRERAREACGERFREVHIKADLAVCEQRDPKGLYRRARAGEIKEFTGISAPYEAPEDPDLEIDTGAMPIDACLEALVDYVETSLADNQTKKPAADVATLPRRA